MGYKITVEEKDAETGKVSVYAKEDKGDHYHITTSVDIPNVGSLRSSYNEPKNGDDTYGQHMTKQK